MKKTSVYKWIITGIKWYVINVIGGILSLGRLTGWLFHDLWCKIRNIDDADKYLIDKSTLKLFLVAMTFFLGLAINIMNILLIIPIALGLQHLIKSKEQKLEKSESADEDFKDVKQWFDGILYAAGIDPILKQEREAVENYISENSKVVDICCGTGALAFDLAKQCKHVTGVDHSSGMIEYADKEKRERGISNVEFVHADATNLSMYQDKTFDYAVLSFSIHEMPPYIRIPALKETARIAKEVIIVDYTIPMPLNMIGVINLHYEIIAGYDHLRNFLNFRDNGGLDDLLNKVGLTIVEETKAHQGTNRIVKTKRVKN